MTAGLPNLINGTVSTRPFKETFGVILNRKPPFLQEESASRTRVREGSAAGHPGLYVFKIGVCHLSSWIDKPWYHLHSNENVS